MSLYRLDYIGTSGKVTGPVKGEHIQPGPNDPEGTRIMPPGDILCRHMATARGHAINAARRAECDVLVSRIAAKNAAVRGVLVIRPDGTGRKPPGTKGEDCKAGPGKPPCFCKNCRAGRRAA